MSSHATLTQPQARFGAMLCAIILVAIYIFEFSGSHINNKGAIEAVVGSITRCSSKRDQGGDIGSLSGSIFIYIDSTGNRPYLYNRPHAFHHRVVKACRTHATVRLRYQQSRPLLKDWVVYTAVGLVDIKNGELFFSLNDWELRNRQLALVVMALVGIALTYFVFVWLGITAIRDVIKVKRRIRSGFKNDQNLIIKSSERNGDIWAFLILFSAAAIWMLMKVYSGQHIAWLLVAAVTSVAAYAYLVEVVNSNYLTLDRDYLVSTSRPLPWIRNPIVIPAADIEYFAGHEQIQMTSQGAVLQYSICVKLLGKPDLLHLFYTRDQAEATAVAELGNERLVAQRPTTTDQHKSAYH